MSKARKPTAPRAPAARQAVRGAGRPRPRGAARGGGRRRRLAAVLRAPNLAQILLGLAAAALLALTANALFQIARKPSELLFPAGGALAKNPAATWARYAPIFRRFATESISPELLAALAQAEAAGDPVAHTYWRWTWTLRPLDMWRPASSSVGMYQMTDGTFAEARRYCIRDHAVRRDDSGNAGNACGIGGYFRILPSDAVELTAAFLDVHVRDSLARNRLGASREQKQRLATVIQLCGAGAGEGFARHGFRFTPGQRCGDHDPATYLAKVDALRREFKRL